MSSLKGWIEYTTKEEKIDKTSLNSEYNNKLSLLKGISKTDSILIEHDIGIWNNNGDINPLHELKDINFKNYSGFT